MRLEKDTESRLKKDDIEKPVGETSMRGMRERSATMCVSEPDSALVDILHKFTVNRHPLVKSAHQS